MSAIAAFCRAGRTFTLNPLLSVCLIVTKRERFFSRPLRQPPLVASLGFYSHFVCTANGHEIPRDWATAQLLLPSGEVVCIGGNIGKFVFRQATSSRPPRLESESPLPGSKQSPTKSPLQNRPTLQRELREREREGIGQFQGVCPLTQGSSAITINCILLTQFPT